MDCTDPHGRLYTETYKNGSGRTVTKKYWGRFNDNGHYVGHDEPSVKFISNAANSGNTMTYFMQIPRDPVKPATNTGSVVDYGELSPAVWFGLPICDPHSYPQAPCTPDSNSNSGEINNPKDAGSAFMELQFYAPKFPGPDEPGCTKTQWCSALTIDSLESQFNFANLNPNCQEPVNFAFIQKNGVPAGPPGPLTQTIHSDTPNGKTLYYSPGNVLKIAISDPKAGLTIRITNMTTHQSGFMVASKVNGFEATNYKTCAAVPQTFHAEYATAAPQNQVPWAALEGGVLMEQEIGHSEVCASLTSHDPFNAPGFFVDNKVFDTCVGGSENGHSTKDPGEGPCNSAGLCKNAQTEGTTGPIACPTNNSRTPQLCEFADGYCVPKGTRAVKIGNVSGTEFSPVNFCADNRFQNGDLDFDGLTYQKTSWPDGSANVPTSFRFVGPFDSAGKPYPQIQFETDAPGSEFPCNLASELNCDVPPLGANFYPFWTLTNHSNQQLAGGLFPKNACVWNFGNVIPGVTTRNFSKDGEYGAPDFARYGGTATSAVMANPETSKSDGCTALAEPK